MRPRLTRPLFYFIILFMPSTTTSTARFYFEIIKKSKKSKARAGIIRTPHGEIHTPAFIPVATQATVKGITVEQLKEMGIESILANTYHLYLRPGDKVVKRFGGLHEFMGWNKPLFTDSGGYQVFSLGAGIEHGVGKIASIFPSEPRRGERRPELVEGQPLKKPPVTPSFRRNKNQYCLPAAKITEDGVYFRSHLDGSQHFIGPEESMKIQENLGADIIFAFDECTSPLHDYKYTKNSMERTHRWAIRSLKAHKRKDQALFGIVQGGAYRDLRIKSTKFISKLDFSGFGIGGSLGKSKKDMHRVLGWTVPLLPDKKPRHLLGIGSMEDILMAVKKGIDTFDCVIPTRLGRNGTALTGQGNLHLRAAKNKLDRNPIEKNCGCYTCGHFARYYLNHLFRAGEMLGPILATIHNLWFMESLMKDIRQRILDSKF